MTCGALTNSSLTYGRSKPMSISRARWSSSIESPNYAPGGLSSCYVYGPVPLTTFPGCLYCLWVGKHGRCCHVDPRPPRSRGPVAHFELLGSSERNDQSDQFYQHLGILQVQQHSLLPLGRDRGIDLDVRRCLAVAYSAHLGEGQSAVTAHRLQSSRRPQQANRLTWGSTYWLVANR